MKKLLTRLWSSIFGKPKFISALYTHVNLDGKFITPAPIYGVEQNREQLAKLRLMFSLRPDDGWQYFVKNTSTTKVGI